MVACWAVSFDAMVVGAQAASIPLALALVCPLIVDGEMAIGTLVLVSIARHVRRRTRVYVGILILASVLVSMAANMAAPYTRLHLNSLPPPFSYLVSGVPSLWIALVVHQLVILWRHLSAPPRLIGVDGAAAIAPTPDADTRDAAPGTEMDATSNGRVTSSEKPLPPPGRPTSRSSRVDGRVDALIKYLQPFVDTGRDPSTVRVGEAAKATGIPRATVYRLLPEALSTFALRVAASEGR